MAGQTGCYEVTWARALGPTSRRLDITALDAERYVIETVRRLRIDDFVESVDQRGSWFDVYGTYRDGLGWFVKIGETDDGVLVLSHHEPERGPLQTISGAKIEVLDRKLPMP